MSDVIYFELNNWFSGRDYPPDGNLSTWVENGQFNNDEWCKENKLCVLSGLIDMSENWCITAPKDWVLSWCPEILRDSEYSYVILRHSINGTERIEYRAKYSDFVREADKSGHVWGRFGWPFLDYEEYNFGSHYYSDDDYEEDQEEDEE